MSKIYTELRIVWITPDGFKFLNKEDADLHCEEFNLLTEQGEINEES